MKGCPNIEELHIDIKHFPLKSCLMPIDNLFSDEFQFKHLRRLSLSESFDESPHVLSDGSSLPQVNFKSLSLFMFSNFLMSLTF